MVLRMNERDYQALGRKLARAQAKLDDVKAEAREAVRQGVAEGRSESELHRWLGVNRMTIRAWLGKRPTVKVVPDPVDTHTDASVWF